MMTFEVCDRVCETLWPDPAAPGPVSARRHYATCVFCQRFFVVQRALGRRLARLDLCCAPEAFEVRLRAAVAQEGPP